MALIENEKGAARLAQAIASDIRLYAGEKLARGEDVRAELNEGRALFQTRVVPRLYPLLEAALAEQQLTSNASAGTLAPVDTSPPSALPTGLFQPAPAVESRGRGPLLLAILVAAALVGWWLAMR